MDIDNIEHIENMNKIQNNFFIGKLPIPEILIESERNAYFAKISPGINSICFECCR